MNEFKCAICGKFISYDSIDSEEVIRERDMALDGEVIQDYFIHKKCESDLNKVINN